MKFRRKPFLVDAYIWTKNGDHPDDKSEVISSSSDPNDLFLTEGRIVRRFRSPDVPSDRMCQHCRSDMHSHGWIDTLEGGHIVCPGDYIITGIKGEHYPCKPDVFANSYDPAEEAQC